jgi:hypothetical protein
VLFGYTGPFSATARGMIPADVTPGAVEQDPDQTFNPADPTGTVAIPVVIPAGSTYARFATFVRGPSAIKDYLAGKWHGLGHNPLGALSVLALLALICLQVGSGLFAQNDDTGFAGPFYALASSSFGELATKLHHKVIDALLILVALHVLAILFYGHVKKDKLLKPMLTGYKEVGAGENARGGGLAAFVVALVIAVAAAYVASGAWVTKPPPPPPAATPAW